MNKENKTEKVKKNNIWHFMVRTFLVLVLVAIIIQMFPKDKKFKYSYAVGKPWNYELLRASFDFPIYKTKKQLEADKKELLKNYYPFFQQDEKKYSIEYNRWLEMWYKSNAEAPTYASYVEKKMKSIYQKGIISLSDYNKLQKEKKENISLITTNREVRLISINDLYTPKKAYEEIIFNKPFDIPTSELNGYNINLFLSENLQYDSLMSEKVKSDKIKKLSKTAGVVQTGEKIIDKGEIITPETFVVLNSLKKELEAKTSTFEETIFVLLGQVILVIGLMFMLFSYFYLFRPEIYEKLSHLTFFSLLILIMVGVMYSILKFTNLPVSIIPFAIIPIVIRVFFDSRTALFVHVIVILMVAFLVTNPFAFIFLQIVAGMVAINGLKEITSRGQLAQISFYVFISYVLMYLSFSLIAEGSIYTIDYRPIIYYSVSSVLLLFTYILIYVFEKIFGLISSVTLVELTNISSDFMLKFAEVAPGSFQHSLQVSNLAAEAAKKINANSLLVRTGALYHDIGKMKNPQYFIENQNGEDNPLLKMSYEEASQAIIRHVTDGIAMAKKLRLPQQIITFISTHHGTSQTRYFYNSFVNENPDVEPDISKFTYPGPRPYSKEMAILMMADAVEARSRTLGEYTEESIRFMVEDMIDKQIADGQFKDAPISFKDVEAVKTVLTEKVKNMYHSRIKYPELKEEA